MLALPIEFEFLVLVEQVIEAKINRTMLSEADFRLENGGRAHALLDFHVGAAARRHVRTASVVA